MAERHAPARVVANAAEGIGRDFAAVDLSRYERVAEHRTCWIRDRPTVLEEKPSYGGTMGIMILCSSVTERTASCREPHTFQGFPSGHCQIRLLDTTSS